MPLVHGKSHKAFEKNVKTEMEAHPGKEHRAQNLAIAYAIKRKAEHHKAHGGEMCAHGGPAHCMEGCYAQGGSVHRGMTESGHEKGINKGRKLEGGKSYAGALARGDVYGGASSKEDNYAYAKEKHRETLHEMKSMPKPKLMAEGGEMSKRDRAMAAFIGSYQKPGNPEVDGDLMPEAHLKEELAEHIHHEPTHDSHVDHDVMNQMGEEDEGAGDMDEIHPMVMKIMMGRAKGYSEGGKVANEESGESSDEPTMAKWDGNEFDDLALDDDLEFNSTGDNAGDHLGDAAEDHDREDIVSRVMRSRSKRDRMAVPGEGSTYGKRK